MTASREIPAVALIGVEHGSGGALHLVLLGVIVALALGVFGVIRWRGRRAAAERQQPAAHDCSAESTDSREEK